MAEYIDREATIKKIHEKQDESSTGLEDVTYYRAIQIIREQPTADLQPVKRGRWIEVDYGMFFECSECGNISEFEHNFCDNCGARMDGDTE